MFFFQNWTQIGRTVLLAIMSYVLLVVFLRISGNRTMSKMNAFDLIVTVALGSTLASIITSQKVPLAQGIAALGTLILLQFVVTWLSVRSSRFGRLVRSSPKLLFYQGKFLDEELKRARVTHDEILQALRSSGKTGTQDIDAVILETDGTLSIMSNIGPDKVLLENVTKPETT